MYKLCTFILSQRAGNDTGQVISNRRHLLYNLAETLILNLCTSGSVLDNSTVSDLL